MKKIVSLTFLFGIIVSHCFTQESTRAFNTFYTDITVDSLPTYPGGEIEFYQTLQEKFRVNSAMRRFANPRMNYLTFNFLVDTSGIISDLQFYESDNVYVEREIERILQKLSKWNPATLDGKNVNARIYVPLNYTLNDNEFLIKNVGTELSVVKNKGKNLIWKALLLAGFVIFFLVSTS